MGSDVIIAPSVLSADFSKLGDEIESVVNVGLTGFISMSWTATSYQTSHLDHQSLKQFETEQIKFLIAT